MAKKRAPAREILRPGEVAILYRVDPRTVTRWAQAGRFPKGTFFFTLSGDRRFYGDKIRAMIAASES